MPRISNNPNNLSKINKILTRILQFQIMHKYIISHILSILCTYIAYDVINPSRSN